MKNQKMKLWKYSGTFLVITGVIHTLYALFLGKDAFAEIINDGLINATGEIHSRAFEGLELNRVQIKCAIGNTPSRNIPRRLGFQFEGVERAGELFPDGSFVDIQVYSLLKNDK